MGVGGVCGCGGVYSGVKIENIQSAKICLNFNFQGRGQYSGVKTENTQSAKICLNFNFRRGGGLSGLKFHRGALWRIWTHIYCLRLVYRNLLVHHR